MNVLARLRYLLFAGLPLVLLGGALLWLNEREQEGGAGRRVAAAARLADEEAVLFVHLPDSVSAREAFESAHFPYVRDRSSVGCRSGAHAADNGGGGALVGDLEVLSEF